MQISIITINYNDLSGLKKTMTSVLEQTYTDIEYLVIDGSSTDGSKEYIETHQKHLAYWVSEPDKGIYNAMNKGIDKATGDYLLFLNSADWLVDAHVIKKVVHKNPTEDIVYGDPMIMVKGKLKRKYMPSYLNTAIALTHTITHQCIFYKQTIFQDNTRYNTEYKIVADWILTTNAIIYKNATSRYMDITICVYNLEGVSSDKQARVAERSAYLKSIPNSVIAPLLTDFSSLQAKYNYLKNRNLIKLVLWIYKKKEEWF